jgi:hypothetical protein
MHATTRHWTIWRFQSIDGSQCVTVAKPTIDGGRPNEYNCILGYVESAYTASDAIAKWKDSQCSAK